MNNEYLMASRVVARTNRIDNGKPREILSLRLKKRLLAFTYSRLHHSLLVVILISNPLHLTRVQYRFEQETAHFEGVMLSIWTNMDANLQFELKNYPE